MVVVIEKNYLKLKKVSIQNIGYSNYAVAEPLLNDPSLGVQLVSDGLELPTLVLELHLIL